MAGMRTVPTDSTVTEASSRVPSVPETNSSVWVSRPSFLGLHLLGFIPRDTPHPQIPQMHQAPSTPQAFPQATPWRTFHPSSPGQSQLPAHPFGRSFNVTTSRKPPLVSPSNLSPLFNSYTFLRFPLEKFSQIDHTITCR